MKRRKFFRTVAAVAAGTHTTGAADRAGEQQPAPTSPAPPALDPTVPPAPLNRTPTAAAPPTQIETAVADEAADMLPKFFNATNLRHCESLVSLSCLL